MALLSAGIQCELREVLLKDKPLAMLELSPKGTVPVLQLSGGRVIDESLDIMRWALGGDDGLEVNDAEMLAVISENDNVFKYHLDRYKYPQRFEADGIDHFQASCVFLDRLDGRLAQSKSLFGDGSGLADMAIFPFVRQFAVVDRQAFAALPYAHLQQWLKGWLDDQRFQNTMLKQTPWQAGDVAVLLCRSG